MTASLTNKALKACALMRELTSGAHMRLDTGATRQVHLKRATICAGRDCGIA
jgi:hypothetical protein